MLTTALIYILGLLIVNSLLVLWFFSPLKTTLSEVFLKQTLMPYEFDDRLYLRNKILGKLSSCWICCSFWLSLVIGIIITIIFYNSIVVNGFALITFFSYPSVCYLFYKTVSSE
jgi:hypothetical protein